MSSEDISLIAVHPVIKDFVFAIIQNIRAKNFNYDQREVIHADFVPRVSEKVMQASMENKYIPSIQILTPPVQKPRPMLPPPKRMIQKPIPIPIQKPIPIPIQKPIPVAPLDQPRVQPIIQPPRVPQRTGPIEGYGKLIPLLNDPSISTIECIGAGKPILVIRAGQRQITKIILTQEEIKDFLTKLSEAVHIPLLEGVFRAAVEDFFVNAVISDIIGSKFIIKKQNAYATLER